jgi:hypothetical protein
MSERLTARQALARVFPGCGQEMYDTKMADRAIAWLDRCGFEIVEKHQVTLAPAAPVETDAMREHADIRHQQALT